MAGVVRASPPPTGAALATGLAVFDLDRTLVAGSCLARLARPLVQARVVGRKEMAGHLLREAVFAARGLGPGTIARLREALLEAATGVEQGPLLDIVDRVAPAIAAEVYPAARWLVDRHLHDGHEVVLLSSSPHELVAAVAAAIDPAVVAVGTLAEVVDGRYTGRLASPFCHGPGKLARLGQVLGWRDLATATAYADSTSDLPVLRASGRPIAVNPDRGLRDLAMKLRWPVLDLS